MRHRFGSLVVAGCAVVALTSGCRPASRGPRLPTGARLDPAGSSVVLGSMPVTMLFSPDSNRIVAVLSGYREQGVVVVDPATHRVVQRLVQPSAFIGATFSPDGRFLYVSGGNRDVVYEYAWRADSAVVADSVVLGPPPGADGGRVYPAGLACSPDGRTLYVTENLADSLAVVDRTTHRVTQRLATGRYPFGVAAGADGRVYVSAWGGAWIACFASRGGALAPGPRIPVGRYPSTLLLDDARGRLYVTCASSDRIAVVDTRADSVIAVLQDSAPGAPPEGSTPNGLAFSPDLRRLYVAEADNNALAVFALGPATSGSGSSGERDSLLGRIPVEWYPTAALARGDRIWSLNAKGRGTASNPRRGPSDRQGPTDPQQYTLGQINGSLSALAVPTDRELAHLSRRVANANGWSRSTERAHLPPFRHVIYVIRENRTFDQVLGDVPGADGDTSLTFFPGTVTPNAHALAERFGVFDRFFVNAEVSGDGHSWSTAAYATDYAEKTVPSAYSDRGRSYDYEGLNRDLVPDDDVNEPANGYLWDLARRARVSLRNYGEYTLKTASGRWAATKPWLDAHTDVDFPGWDLGVPDTVRAARWIGEFRRQLAVDSMPALTILRLPNDHTAGGKAGAPTPRAFVADNDRALGQVIEALTHSRYWPSTVVFVLEDDAQDGPDHVDSHRSPLLVISAYNRAGVRHTFANTTDVIATIDRILGLGALSQFDRFGRTLDWAFAATPDTSAYTALRPEVPMNEVNPHGTRLAMLSRRLDLTFEDRADEALFNHILWRMIKGPTLPYPVAGGDPLARLGLR
jgi:YVTN family beta-propeller protein